MTTPATVPSTPATLVKRAPHDFAAAVFTAVADAIEKGGDLAPLKTQLDELAKSFLASPEGDGKSGAFIKLDTGRRTISGWASVVTKHGEPVVDRQGDVMDIDNLRAVVHKFMAERMGKLMHAGSQVGEVVDSVVFDSALQKALGIDLGCEGWFVSYHVTDDAVWQEVEKGTYRAFSIGGSGERTPIVE